MNPEWESSRNKTNVTQCSSLTYLFTAAGAHELEALLAQRARREWKGSDNDADFMPGPSMIQPRIQVPADQPSAGGGPPIRRAVREAIYDPLTDAVALRASRS